MWKLCGENAGECENKCRLQSFSPVRPLVEPFGPILPQNLTYIKNNWQCKLRGGGDRLKKCQFPVGPELSREWVPFAHSGTENRGRYRRLRLPHLAVFFEGIGQVVAGRERHIAEPLWCIGGLVESQPHRLWEPMNGEATGGVVCWGWRQKRRGNQKIIAGKGREWSLK